MGSTEMVELYVYDMSKGLAKAATSPIFGGVEAVFHTGVFVFDREYSYGTKGIKESPPLSLRPYLDHPHKIEKIDKTSKSLRELNEFVRELGKNTFRACDYNVLRHNCNIFSQTLCKFLCGVGIPKYILNLQKNTSENIDNLKNTKPNKLFGKERITIGYLADALANSFASSGSSSRSSS